MEKALAMFVAAAFLAAAGPAAPQAPAPAAAPEQSQTQPPAQSPKGPAAGGTKLNLRLDEADQPRPRITFGPRDGDKKQDSANGLPSLGGSPSRSWEQPASSPIPKDSTPGL